MGFTLLFPCAKCVGRSSLLVWPEVPNELSVDREDSEEAEPGLNQVWANTLEPIPWESTRGDFGHNCLTMSVANAN